MRVTMPVTLFATDAWLASACAAIGEGSRVATRELRAARGGCKAGVVEIDDGAAGVGSVVLLAAADAAAFGAGQVLAAFDRRVEALQWLGEDLLLGFAVPKDLRAFSIFPGLRILPAPAPLPLPGDAPGGLSWLRLSTRRSRR